jgi:hypothetical protein
MRGKAIGHRKASGRISDSAHKPQLKERRKKEGKGSNGGLYALYIYLH